MKNALKVIFVIIGAVIGAGFASGKEIYLFFNIYGVKGFVGIGIASILTGFIIYKVLKHLRDNEINNYEKYLEKLGVNKKIGEMLNLIINIFLLISFYIMIAGFCAYFKQQYNIPEILTGVIVAFLCYITLMGNIEGVTKANTILVPLLIIMIIFIGVKNGMFNLGEIFNVSTNIENQLEGQKNWLLSSIEYASYNSILLIPMLIGIKNYAKNKEKAIGIIVGISFFILACILYIVLLNGGTNIANIELPLIYIVNQFGDMYKYIYGIVIVSAIYTTAMASGYSFIQNSSKTKRGYKLLTVTLCVSSIFISKIGFSYLVNLLYPLFGILGLIQVFYICKKN